MITNEKKKKKKHNWTTKKNIYIYITMIKLRSQKRTKESKKAVSNGRKYIYRERDLYR